MNVSTPLKKHGLRILRREIARKVGQVGIWATIRHGAHRLARTVRGHASITHNNPDPFDSEYGTDTAAIVPVGALDIPDVHLKHATRYEPVASQLFSEMLASLPLRHDEYVFIDLGSGKGRALLLASSLPFKEIIGVELSPGLAAIAAQNVRIARTLPNRSANIRIVCADAADYEFPGENAVVFLYNPFDAKIMSSVIKKLEDLVLKDSRKVFVAYNQPLQHALWEKSAAFSVLKATQRWVTYQSRTA